MSQIKDKDKIETGGSRIKFWGGAVIVLMIILMFMPWNVGQRTHDDHHGTVIGTASGGRKVTAGESMQAEHNLELLQSLFVFVQRDPNNPGEPTYEPLLNAIWGADRVTEMKRNAWAYHLLVQESRKFGLGENLRTLGPLERDNQDARGDGIFNSGFVSIQDLHPLFGSELYNASHGFYGRTQSATQVFRITYQNGTSVAPERRLVSTLAPIEQQRIHSALRDLLAVQSAASLAETAVKPSPLLVDQFIARNGQRFTLKVAGIDAKPLIDAVSVPSDSELKAQLDAHANVPPGQVTAANPFGFGYQVPNAVKFQMISFSRADVRKVVEAEKTPYEWEVDARMAYAKDPGPFKSLASTQPTTGPATAPSTDLTQAEPFDNIKAGAIRVIVDNATKTRVDDIIRKIRSTMSLDHQSWLTSQSSSLGVSYDSIDYLNKLAANIQAEARFKVLPTVLSEQSRFLGAEELLLQPAIANLYFRFPLNTMRQLNLQTPVVAAAPYLITFAKPFLDKKDAEKAGSAVLEMYRPSEPLSDENDDTVAFIRLTDTAAAHAATDIEPLRARLVTDVNRSKAQQKAIDAAGRAIEAIKASGKFEVPNATVATVNIAPNTPAPTELGISGPAYGQFNEEVGRNLLDDPNGQPLAALNVPLADRVFVAQRVGLEALWTTEEELNGARLFRTGEMTLLMQLPKTPRNGLGMSDKSVSDSWVSVEEIRKRNQWASTSGHSDEESEEQKPTTQPK